MGLESLGLGGRVQAGDAMLTATEAAQALGVSKRHLYALAAKGLLPCYRFGSAVRFDPQDIEAYKQSCRSPATTMDGLETHRLCRIFPTKFEPSRNP